MDWRLRLFRFEMMRYWQWWTGGPSWRMTDRQNSPMRTSVSVFVSTRSRTMCLLGADFKGNERSHFTWLRIKSEILKFGVNGTFAPDLHWGTGCCEILFNSFWLYWNGNVYLYYQNGHPFHSKMIQQQISLASCLLFLFQLLLLVILRLRPSRTLISAGCCQAEHMVSLSLQHVATTIWRNKQSARAKKKITEKKKKRLLIALILRTQKSCVAITRLTLIMIGWQTISATSQDSGSILQTSSRFYCTGERRGCLSTLFSFSILDVSWQFAVVHHPVVVFGKGHSACNYK